ncbi:hypothetical protein BDQ17DRAFT_635946 [Cyathus striatus]|nr:hypothetical protein BDQ17DRAFT_635946 [Cyathus striatus]
MSLEGRIQFYHQSDMDLNDADLTSFIQNNIEISAVFVAAITALVYDIMYNFTEEVKYIWSGMKWSLPNYCTLLLGIPVYFTFCQRGLSMLYNF